MQIPSCVAVRLCVLYFLCNQDQLFPYIYYHNKPIHLNSLSIVSTSGKSITLHCNPPPTWKARTSKSRGLSHIGYCTHEVLALPCQLTTNDQIKPVYFIMTAITLVYYTQNHVIFPLHSYYQSQQYIIIAPCCTNVLYGELSASSNHPTVLSIIAVVLAGHAVSLPPGEISACWVGVLCSSLLIICTSGGKPFPGDPWQAGMYEDSHRDLAG